MRDRIPNGKRTRSSALAVALVTCAAIASSDCSETPLRHEFGDLTIEVFLARDTAVQSLSYQVSGNGIQPITQVVLISGSPTTTSALFVGLPVGPYQIGISAMCVDATISCQASAVAIVLENQTTNLLMPLKCQGPPDGHTTVTATVGSCPHVSYLTAAPTTTSVGGQIGLAAKALEPDSSTLTFAWTASAGSFSAPTAPSSTFTCTAAGDATITLTVSNGSCGDHVSVTVTCVPP